MADALIGFTGFVGQNICRLHEFEAQFNSRNISEVRGGSYEVIVCAAAPATMWAANKDPDGDLRNIRELVGHLEHVTAERFVLISTVAVLDGADAGLDETTSRFETAKAYGRNRRFLEEACASRFSKSHILRLPALFGRGLKKNFLFDILNPIPSFLASDKYAELLQKMSPRATSIMQGIYRFADDFGMYRCERHLLNRNQRSILTEAMFEIDFTALNFTNADSTFQYYGLSSLWSDIVRAIEHDLPVMHLAPAPLCANEIYAALTGRVLESRAAPLYREDMHTQFAGLWDNQHPYTQGKADVLAGLKIFFNEASQQ
ncbi:sugar nucleotide-binding protein [Starkeya sp. ORNL1]|uniref:sugar nucleotide-binding protein n=1 Tax=Starkeya sp. ORNL1 TaxID=2709380 RepID=UPI0014638BDD|nr:sugar nucleotide-binding protein [Starkeya sp. ORNL1]QJP16153.1 sugar nucleotide-binding protein [Starkeya sp. ORNL1]